MMPATRPGTDEAEIAALPLEERYAWRELLRELLPHRPLQFCLFLSALFGQKQMEMLMVSAIKNARAVAAQSGGRS